MSILFNKCEMNCSLASAEVKKKKVVQIHYKPSNKFSSISFILGDNYLCYI